VSTHMPRRRGPPSTTWKRSSATTSVKSSRWHGRPAHCAPLSLDEWLRGTHHRVRPLRMPGPRPDSQRAAPAPPLDGVLRVLPTTRVPTLVSPRTHQAEEPSTSITLETSSRCLRFLLPSGSSPSSRPPRATPTAHFASRVENSLFRQEVRRFREGPVQPMHAAVGAGVFCNDGFLQRGQRFTGFHDDARTFSHQPQFPKRNACRGRSARRAIFSSARAMSAMASAIWAGVMVSIWGKRDLSNPGLLQRSRPACCCNRCPNPVHGGLGGRIRLIHRFDQCLHVQRWHLHGQQQRKKDCEHMLSHSKSGTIATQDTAARESPGPLVWRGGCRQAALSGRQQTLAKGQSHDRNDGSRTCAR
jgi:hypothetical protein